MSDDYLFHKYDLRKVIDSQCETLRKELDDMQDSRLLNMDLAALQSYAAEKYTINLPVLGDPVVDEGRTKMQVGRYGGYSRGDEETVLVDAQRYTLEVPFEGNAGGATKSCFSRRVPAPRRARPAARFVKECCPRVSWNEIPVLRP